MLAILEENIRYHKKNRLNEDLKVLLPYKETFWAANFSATIFYCSFCFKHPYDIYNGKE